MKTYVYFNPQHSLVEPIHVFTNYDGLIRFIRRMKHTGTIIWQIEADEWDFPDGKNVTDEVMTDAWENPKYSS